MNLQALYDLKERLEYAAIAGTGLLQEDFRLHRAVEALAPLAGVNPVFAKISAAAKALLNAPQEERSLRLLDVLSLVDAVAYTQGVTNIPGEMVPMEPGIGTYVEVSYGQLLPLLTALSGSGSGRTAVIREAWQQNPEYFRDFRVLPHVVTALGDSYPELTELVFRILLNQGQVVLPLLKAGFDPAGKKDMARRVRLVAKLAGAAENDWFVSILPDSKREVREAVIQALSLSRDNARLLQDLCHSERGKMKEAAMRSLLIVEDEAAVPLWQKVIAKHPYALHPLAGAGGVLAADLTAAQLQTFLEELLADPNMRDVFHPLTALVNVTSGKYSARMAEVWHWIGANMETLHQIPVDDKQIHSDLSVAELLQRSLMESILVNPCPEMYAMARSLAEANREWFLCGAFLADLEELTPARFYDTYGPLVVESGLLKWESAAERNQRIQILRGLGPIFWNAELRAYCVEFMSADPLEGERVVSLRKLKGLDRRWLTLLMDGKRKDDGGAYQFGMGAWYSRVDPAREWLLGRLIDQDQPEICKCVGNWFFESLKKTGIGREAIPALMKCGWKDWKDVFLNYSFQDKELHHLSMITRYFSQVPMSNEDRITVLKRWDAMMRTTKSHALHGWVQWELSRLE